jgi:site-specific recombinase XerD
MGTFAQSFSDNLKKTKLDTELGDSTISCHTVRHYFCTMYLVRGGTLHNLQRITGHKTIDTLLIYVNLANQMTLAERVGLYCVRCSNRTCA